MGNLQPTRLAPKTEAIKSFEPETAKAYSLPADTKFIEGFDANNKSFDSFCHE